MRHNLPHNNAELIWSTWGIPESCGTAAARTHRIGAGTIRTAIWKTGSNTLLAISNQIDAPTWTMPGFPGTATPRLCFPAESALDEQGFPELGGPGWMYAWLGKERRYALLPAYPELPVCVRLRHPVMLPPMTNIQGILASYVQAELHIGSHKAATLPLQALQKTLYGSTTSGLVCYVVDGSFIPDDLLDDNGGLKQADQDFDASRILHPVRIRNNTSEVVHIQDLCVYGSQLSIFRKGRQLFSEKIQFAFGPSRVRMSIESSPRRSSDTVILAEAQTSGEDTVIERSIEMLRAITRM
ncbi:MAG: hypothetical protein KKI09_03900 [Spirochaetes bacterium]|nr:hypothetical protein [Spirochaetota bacterium]MBU0954551.1 hypothetical protein [Spirochaetota bacterium]